jgi:beta-lactamase regulating signal transducer with metallopeptidase domain/protocatechuate 3,4-dioxygenase beta subunit
MHAAQISTSNALGAFLAIVAGHPLLERLFFASIELALLAVLVDAAIRVGRIRSARLASVLWLLVLAKPLVSLAIGSPVPLVRMHVPEIAVADPLPDPKLEPIVPQPTVPQPTGERPKPDDPQLIVDDMGQTSIGPELESQPFAVPGDPVPTIPEPITREPSVAETPPVVPGPPLNPVASKLPAIVLAVWLCGAALFALRSLIDRIRVRRLVRGARRPEASLTARYKSVASQLKLSRPVAVRVTTELEGPALVGSIFPTVLVPDWLVADPNPARLDWALRHELMHWKLRDPLAGLVREFAQMLFYFHPAAWWAGRRWEVAAEQACDRAIVTNAADSADYAEQLYGILVGMQGRLRARIGNGLFATRTQIGQRIAALLNGPLTPRAHLSVLALFVVTIFAAVTLSIGGAFADKNAEHAEGGKSDQTQTVATQEARAEQNGESANEKVAVTASAPTTAPGAPVRPPVMLGDVPIRGRFLDSEGRPVARATVQVVDVWQRRDGSQLTSEKIAKAATYRSLLQTLRPLTDINGTSGARAPVLPPVQTDSDGRFTLHGVGRDRLADVLIRAPRVETTLLHVRSQRGDVIKGLGRDDIFYPCEFTRVLGPSTPVEGRIVDAASKQPIAGVLVRPRADDPPNRWLPDQYLSARTNADGRYRLEGLPIGRNVLEIVPPGDSPFIPQFFLFPTRFSPVPAIANVTLAHGTRVRGRAIDARTGRPVQGVVDYFAFRTNPALAGVVNPPRQGNLLNTGIRSDENGVFEIAALPGPGIVTFRADRQDEFPWGQGADRVHGATVTADDGPYDFVFSTAPMECKSGFYHVLTPVDPAPGAESLALDLKLRSIVTVTAKVLSPDGKALSDYSIFDDHVPLGERGASWRWASDGTFEVIVYSPTDRHRLLIYQRKLDLAGFCELTGEPAGPLEIKLQPAGTIVGRLVDRQAKPLPKVAIVISSRTGPTKHSGAGSDTNAIDQKQISTDEQGRFQVHGVIPGLSYSAETIGLIEDSEHRRQPPGAIFKDVMADAGQTRDLGDLRIALTQAKTATEPPKRADKSVDENLVHGRVLLPDGKPAAGARVLAVRRFWTARIGRRPVAEAVAGANGEFIIRFSKHQPHAGAGAAIRIVAKAGGFAPQWSAWSGTRDSAKELDLTLVASSPIHGRILDLEGKPIRGVRVKPVWQQAPKNGLEAWLKATQSGDDTRETVLDNGGELPAHDDPALAPAVTDTNGRFSLDGIGTDRVARLELRGESIAYAEIDVVTRPIQPITRKDEGRQATRQLFGSDFTYQAAPTRPIVGTVRDATTGAPLAGVSIQSRHLSGAPTALEGVLETKTDAQGRYRLVGMGKGHGSEPNDESAIAVVPNEDQPYLGLIHRPVPESAGLDAITLDFRLTRGLWITGRVIDKSTGAPVTASMLYSPSQSNPFVANLPEIKRTGRSSFDNTHNMTQPDGTYRLVGFPGPGLVSAHAYGRTYRLDAGASEIPAMTKDGRYPAVPGFEPLNANAVKEINPRAGTTSVTCDLALEAGEKIHISAIDRAGKPAGLCLWCFSYSKRASNVFGGSRDSLDIAGLAPNESRPLVVVQPQRRIGKILTVHNKDGAPHSLTITLDACVTVKGRLVDGSGVPLDHVWVKAAPRGYAEVPFMPQVFEARTDGDGRFALDNLPADCGSYSLVATREELEVANKVLVVAGQAIDLGEIKVKDRDKTTSATNPPAAPGEQKSTSPVAKANPEELIVHGRVLLPDGKPAVGARIVALRHYRDQSVKRTPLAKTIAGAEGQFTIQVPMLSKEQAAISGGMVGIAAEVSGLGTQWEQLTRANKTTEVALKLVAEAPIHGRIVDLEGKPVQGARVTLLWQQVPREEFGAWLEAVKSGSQDAFSLLTRGGELQGYDNEGQVPILTDQNGRFTLPGVGADRVVHLAVRGESIAYAEIDVVTRPIEPFARKLWRGTAEVFGADFTYHALPTRPIVGTVRDAASGAPLAGVTIENRRGVVSTATDGEGKYRLVGMPKGKGGGDSLVAVPNQDRQPYFRSAAAEVPDSPGVGSLPIDFKLTRGIWISGRVTDKATGAPALAQVFYRPTAANPNVAKFDAFDPGAIAPLRMTKSDGSFRQLAMPGHGVVWARGMRYLYRWAGQDLKAMEPSTRDAYADLKARGLGALNALHEFDAKPGSESIACDLVLDPGGVIPLSIVDPAGKPVSQCIFVFNTMTYGAAAPFEMRGMEPNESRGVLFRSGPPNLGKVQVLHYDGKATRRPVTVKLEPYATVTGRLLDEEGAPLKFVNVQVTAQGNNYVLPPFASGVESQADGRFAVKNVAAGGEYYVVDADGFDEPIAKRLSIAAGKTIDLGDIKRKRKEIRVSSSKPNPPVIPAPTSKKTAAVNVNAVHGRVRRVP